MPVNRAASETKIASAPIPWTSTEALSQPVADFAGGGAGADLSLRPGADGPREVCGRRGLPDIGHPIPSANVEAGDGQAVATAATCQVPPVCEYTRSIGPGPGS